MNSMEVCIIFTNITIISFHVVLLLKWESVLNMYILAGQKSGAQGVQHLPDVSQLRGSRGRDCGSRLSYSCSMAPLLWMGRWTRGRCCCIVLLLWLGSRGGRNNQFLDAS